MATRRGNRAGRRVQRARADHGVHAYVPHVRVFVDPIAEPALAGTERQILADAMAARKKKAARMAGTSRTDKRAAGKFNR